MTAPRNPPPDLPGFEFLKGLGGGGFADVFLYQQRRPSRQVAVKVLRDEHLSDENRRQFETEADLMAELSGHPNIVTIFAADVAPDGRPFIVMEYCPQPHFGLRARGGRMPVAEALRVGVQVAAAVDAAHTAGILHRDIKPANILTTAYGDPGLTDFGIAGVTRESEIAGAGGLSYAYSAPEVIQDPNLTGSVAADVYALGATIYCLLAGRSPFWVPGGDNSDEALVSRVLVGRPPPTGRADVAPELELLLAQTLERDPHARPHSAGALALALQDVEQGLRLAPTPIPTVKAHTAAPIRPDRQDDEDGTRRGNVSVVDPDPPAILPAPPIIASPPPARSPAEQRWLDPEDPATVRREGRGKPRSADPTPEPATPASGDGSTASGDRGETPAGPQAGREPRHRPPWIWVAGAAALVVVVGLGVLLGSGGSDGGDPNPTTTAEEGPDPLPPSAPGPPAQVTAQGAGPGVLTVIIEPPESPSGDDLEYLIARKDGEAWPNGERLVVESSPSGTTQTSIEGVDLTASVCVDVYAKRGTLLSAAPTSACTGDTTGDTTGDGAALDPATTGSAAG